MDFTRNERLTQDARHKDNLFAYGHIGTFKTQYRPLYTLGSDTITDPNDPNYGKVMDAYTLAVFQSANVDYTPGENNPILANYTSNFYDFVDQNLIFNRARSLEDIRAGGGLLNGDQPSSVRFMGECRCKPSFLRKDVKRPVPYYSLFNIRYQGPLAYCGCGIRTTLRPFLQRRSNWIVDIDASIAK